MRALLLLALLAAHASLLWRWHRSGEPPRPQEVVRVLTELLLIEPRRPRPEARLTPKPERAPSRAPRAALPVLSAPVEPVPIAPPAVPATPSPQGDAVSAGSGRAPLNLALPSRGASHPYSMEPNPALSDPRANTPKLTFSEKFAIAAGEYQCIIIERSPEGRYERYPGDLKDMASASAAWGSGGSANVCVRKPGSVPVR